MELQYKSEGGKWYAVDSNRVQEFITKAQEIFPNAIELLESGAEVKYAPYWYAKIRVTRQPVAKTTAAEEWVLCDCGDIVKSRLVMSASLGTSCPDCYDEMSN